MNIGSAMNLMSQGKQAWETFKRNHPEFPKVLNYVKNKGVPERTHTWGTSSRTGRGTKADCDTALTPRRFGSSRRTRWKPQATGSTWQSWRSESRKE